MKYFISYVIEFGEGYNKSYGNMTLKMNGFIHATNINEVEKFIKNNINKESLIPVEKIIILNFKLLEDKPNE